MINEISVTFREDDGRHIPVAVLHDDQVRIDIEVPMHRYSVSMEYFEPVVNSDDEVDEFPNFNFEKSVHPELLGHLNMLAQAVRETLTAVKLADRVSPEATIQFPLPRLMQFITGASGAYPWETK